jgi:lipoate-protein ligase A
MAFLLFDDGAAPGERNMQRDIELMRRCAAGGLDGALRLYEWSPPCLSIGATQSMDDVDVDACRRDGIDVVRRPSGGRAVLHDDEVTYALVCRTDDIVFGGTVLRSCERIHETVAEALRLLGVDTVAHCSGGDVRAVALELSRIADCFARPAQHELLDTDARKLIGSAQHRFGDVLLQHGSIPLGESRADRYLHGARPVDRTSLRRLAGSGITARRVREAMIAAFGARTGGLASAPAAGA